jgi:F420-non-reducing hydrogenase iron-sulfur subunit
MKKKKNKKVVTMEEFEPKIMSFICNWSNYVNIDLENEGIDPYSDDTKIVNVTCSCLVDPAFILESFRGGSDGVIVLGCHLNNCRYDCDSYEEDNKWLMLQRLLEIVDFDKRLILDWESDSEGIRLKKVVKDFKSYIYELGPSPFNHEDIDEITVKFDAIGRVVNDPRIREFIGRERIITSQDNIMQKTVDKQYYENLLKAAVEDEYYCQRMLMMMYEEAKSVKEMAITLNISTGRIGKYLNKLKEDGLVDIEKVDEISPLYQATV